MVELAYTDILGSSSVQTTMYFLLLITMLYGKRKYGIKYFTENGITEAALHKFYSIRIGFISLA